MKELITKTISAWIAVAQKSDRLLLSFLIVFPVNMVIIKPVALALALYFIRRDISKEALRKIPKFYWLLPLFEIPKWFFLRADHTGPSVISASIGILYWLMCAGAFLVVYTRVHRNRPAIRPTLDVYFVVNAVVSIIQLCITAWRAGNFNPYSVSSDIYGASTGDFIRGLIFGPSYLNMMVNAAFAIYYLYANRRKAALLAVLIICLTATNFGNLVFLPLLLLSAMLLKKRSAVITMLLQLVIFSGYYLIISPSNAAYMNDSFGQNGLNTFKEYNGGKGLAFYETAVFTKGSAQHLTVGAGIGSFSSMLALNTSGLTQNGKRSRLFAKLPEYIAPEYRANHYAIYEKVLAAPVGWHSVRHMPASFLNQIVGEYGLFGVLLFLFFYLGHFYKRWRILSYGRILIVLLCGFLMFDYLFEYLSVVLFFETFILLDATGGRAPVVP